MQGGGEAGAEPPRLVVVTPVLTRDNGGSATAIDLVNAALSLGTDTVMLLTADGRWRHSFPSRNPTPLPFSRRHVHALSPGDAIPSGVAPEVVRTPVSARQRFGLIRRWTKQNIKNAVLHVERTWTRRSAEQALASASVVVDVGGNMRRGSSAGKRMRPEAVLVFNHNASMDQAAAAISGTRNPNSIDWASYRSALRDYDAILLQSDDVAEQISVFDADLGRRCVVVRPSCDEPAVLASLTSTSPFKTGERAVLIVGSVQPRKNQLAAVEALCGVLSAGQATLHLVGALVDRDYVRLVKERAALLGVTGSVVVHGHRSDYLRYLAHADIVLQPSLAEGVSRILREAMLLAKPVVASAIPGTLSVLRHRQSALLVDPENTSSIGEAIREVLEDHELAARLGSEARSWYLQHNNWTNYLIGVRGLVGASQIAEVDAVPRSAEQPGRGL